MYETKILIIGANILFSVFGGREYICKHSSVPLSLSLSLESKQSSSHHHVIGHCVLWFFFSFFPSRSTQSRDREREKLEQFTSLKIESNQMRRFTYSHARQFMFVCTCSVIYSPCAFTIRFTLMCWTAHCGCIVPPKQFPFNANHCFLLILSVFVSFFVLKLCNDDSHGTHLFCQTLFFCFSPSSYAFSLSLSYPLNSITSSPLT